MILSTQRLKERKHLNPPDRSQNLTFDFYRAGFLSRTISHKIHI